jgi:hypothetical protein
VFNVLKNFIQNTTNNSLSSTSLESTILASHQQILTEIQKFSSNQQILADIQKVSKFLETRPVASGSAPVFSEDIYVSVADDDIVYHLCTSTGFEQGSVDNDWVGSVLSLSLLSVASSKCNVGLMYLPRVLDIENDNEDNYSLDAYSYICGILTFKNKVFYVIGNRQRGGCFRSWVNLLQGQQE